MAGDAEQCNAGHSVLLIFVSDGEYKFLNLKSKVSDFSVYLFSPFFVSFFFNFSSKTRLNYVEIVHVSICPSLSALWSSLML